MPSRWAFEAIGHDLGARRILASDASPLGPPLLASYGDAGTASSMATYCLVLAVFAVAFVVGHLGRARPHHTAREPLTDTVVG